MIKKLIKKYSGFIPYLSGCGKPVFKKNGSERKTNFIKELLITTCAGLPNFQTEEVKKWQI